MDDFNHNEFVQKEQIRQTQAALKVAIKDIQTERFLILSTVKSIEEEVLLEQPNLSQILEDIACIKSLLQISLEKSSRDKKEYENVLKCSKQAFSTTTFKVITISVSVFI